MSTLTKVLERNIKVIEKNADLTEGRFRLGHHLMPPVGWLNDPNGLCWYKGRYHVFFQYAPFDVEGGLKFWGHYTSEDLVDWKYEGTALYPDSPYDCHGVYSGSALAESEKLHLFFTGNVKIDGDYDYINEGRETSTLHVESEDGIHFGDKEEIISFDILAFISVSLICVNKTTGILWFLVDVLREIKVQFWFMNQKI